MTDDLPLWSERALTRVLAYINGTAVDITSYVLNPTGGVSANRGRQTELAGMDPSRLGLSLNNQDGRFTPGNPSSPYYPYWRQSARVVWLETIGARSWTHFDGYLEIPEVQLNYQDSAGTNDRVLRLAAVDGLTRAARMRPFISTLGAHIIGSSTTLAAYWPLNGASTTFQPAVGTGPIRPKLGALVTPRDQAGPAGDDETYATVSGVPASISLVPVIGYIGLLEATLSGLSIGAGQSMAISVWVRIGTDGTTYGIVSASSSFQRGLSLYYGGASTVTGRFNNNTILNDAAYAGALPPESWQLLTVRVSFASGDLTLWFGKSIVATATVGSPPSTFTPLKLTIGDDGQATGAGNLGIYASLAHLQIYAGTTADAFPYEAHLAQLEVGLQGLHRQTTGQRIRTIAGYAGYATSALDGVDDGSSVMQRATLAGQTPAQAWQTAADTERGRLFSAGDGSLTFHDRHRIYNT